MLHSQLQGFFLMLLIFKAQGLKKATIGLVVEACQSEANVGLVKSKVHTTKFTVLFCAPFE